MVFLSAILDHLDLSLRTLATSLAGELPVSRLDPTPQEYRHAFPEVKLI